MNNNVFIIILVLDHVCGVIFVSTYPYSGKFSGEISWWFSIIKIIHGKNSLVYTLVLNNKIKSSWVKHSWFYSNHKNHEDISPQKFPAIW